MKLAEIKALMEQMTGEIRDRQDMLTVLHRLRNEATTKKGKKTKGVTRIPLISANGGGA